MKDFDTNLKSPFPYFGGKGNIADIIWSYLGDVKQYIEPFCGSCAVLLKRPPSKHKLFYEIVNDMDGNIANVWRSIQFSPDETAKWCDWPINHADLMARKKYIIENKDKLLDGLCNDPKFHDPELAGYYIWCASCWIGSGLTCPTQRPHLGSNKGIHSQRPHLARNTGIINSNNVYEWLNVLSKRLRNVKVVCGDWTRVCGGNWQANNKPVGFFLDPPYASEHRCQDIYDCESMTVAKEVEKWVLERGKNPDYRICVAGYDDEYADLIDAGWHVHYWSANGGYGNLGDKAGKVNRHRERLLFSPHCLKQLLF